MEKKKQKIVKKNPDVYKNKLENKITTLENEIVNMKTKINKICIRMGISQL